MFFFYTENQTKLSLLLEEDQLIAGLRAQDRKTVDYLYDKYSRDCLLSFSGLLPIRTLPKVFHDAFIKITRKIDSYDESKEDFILGWPTSAGMQPLINQV